jgi:hypothetical protein
MNLLKNNDDRYWTDLEWINEFYEFLQGVTPDGISVRAKVKLTQRKAFSIIWYLQEHFPLLPDHIERCDTCGQLYDSWSQGRHSDLTDKFYCNESCEPADLWEREQREELKAEKKFKKMLHNVVVDNRSVATGDASSKNAD